MSALTAGVFFVPMARKSKEAAPTDQINFRLKVATIDRMERFKERHHLHPTLTQIVEAAVNEWLDAHESEAAKPKPKRE